MTREADDERWVVLGLASPRSGWFSEVTRWANASAIPVDFVKCVSANEVRARLTAGRSYSALLVGSDLPALDRDLVEASRSVGAAVLVVGERKANWAELGVSAALPDGFDRAELLSALSDHAPPITRVHSEVTRDVELDPGWQGSLVAVTGPGGAGSSVVAMALAQGLGSAASNRGLVLLADLALEADLAMLHDARELVPGLQELVEGHRGGRISGAEIRRMVFDAPERGYHLLLGLRRHRDWTAIRPRAVAASVEGLQHSYRLVVADVDPDIEGEAETGSLDVEDRNLLARTILFRADVTVVVGVGGLKGLHSLTRTIRELVAGGLDPERMVIAVNRAPRSPRRRAEMTAALAELLDGPDVAGLDNPIFIPDRRDVETALIDGARLPAALARALTAEIDRRQAPAGRLA